jgi:hypothetical protein
MAPGHSFVRASRGASATPGSESAGSRAAGKPVYRPATFTANDWTGLMEPRVVGRRWNVDGTLAGFGRKVIVRDGGPHRAVPCVLGLPVPEPIAYPRYRQVLPSQKSQSPPSSTTMLDETPQELPIRTAERLD